MYKVGLVVFSILAIIFLDADNRRLKAELKERRDNPDE